MKANQKFPTISVIIPSWNGASRIGKTLDALQMQTADSDDFEVIVIDNGSTDETRAVVSKYSKVRLLIEPEPGSYRARNKAISDAKGRFLLFTDDDCIPDIDWLKMALIRAERHGSFALIGGMIRLFKEGAGSETLVKYEQITAFQQQWNLQNQKCVTANWLCSAQLLNQVGKFDSKLFSGGDVDCAGKIATIGAEMIFAPEMVVNHPSRARLSTLLAKKRRVMGGRWAREFKTLPLSKVVKSLIVEAVNEARWLKNHQLNQQRRYRLAGLSAMILLINLYEVFRLKLGFRPLRQ